MTALVVLPTYNEAENISEMIQLIREHTQGLDLDILVVDSNSQDGTARRVRVVPEADGEASAKPRELRRRHFRTLALSHFRTCRR